MVIAVRPAPVRLLRSRIALSLASLLLGSWYSAAQTPCSDGAPGCYRPVFDEPGFHERGDYSEAAFQANVNLFGGNLVVTAKDVDIPSTGLFSLAFRRTHNTLRLPSARDPDVLKADSPLGLGWTAHLGVLWPVGSGQLLRPVLVTGSGAREPFYVHNRLTTDIPITSSYGVWISTSYKVLRKLDVNGNQYSLLTPEGLRYTFTRLSQYAYWVPTRVDDAHGNGWDISYTSDSAPYFEHPLMSQITDGWGRTLYFNYDVPRDQSQSSKRLSSISFGMGGPHLAYYTYRVFDGLTFFWKHTTPEGRVTEYHQEGATSQAAIHALGVIRSIRPPTGGLSTFDYALKTFYYKVAEPTQVYALTDISRGGIQWDYSYPTPSAPPNGRFVVTTTTSDGFSGRYQFSTYSATFCTDLYRIGMLLESTESYNSTTRSYSQFFQPFQISEDILSSVCADRISVARKTSDSLSQDGFNLVTQYSQYDALNYPARVDQPGSIHTDRTYQHVRSNDKYLLGLPKLESRFTSNILIRKTEHVYTNTLSTYPSNVRLFKDASQHDQVQLSYFSLSPRAGELQSRAAGRYFESYTYDYGVPENVTFPLPPHITRTINRNGTIHSERRNGVLKTFTWDNDARLTGVQLPTPYAPIRVTYATNSREITRTQGPREVRLSYDDMGRLTERREKVDSSPLRHRLETFGSFNYRNEPGSETDPSNASYTIARDVQDRLRSRTRVGGLDTTEFSYATDAGGTEVTHRRNGVLIRKTKHDHLQRMIYGATNQNEVSMSYSGTQQTISIPGHRNRTVEYDLLSRKSSERHPETGLLSYHYTQEGWSAGVTKPTGSYTSAHDDRGRRTAEKHNGTVLSSFAYESTFGVLRQSEHQGFIETRSNFDSLGLPQTVVTRIPRALPSPSIIYPYSYVHRGAIPASPSMPGYRPDYEWHAVPGAARYQLEVRIPNYWSPTRRTPGTLCDQASTIERSETTLTRAPLSAFGGAICFRVRAVSSSGEPGPFSRWVAYKKKGTTGDGRVLSALNVSFPDPIADAYVCGPIARAFDASASSDAAEEKGCSVGRGSQTLRDSHYWIVRPAPSAVKDPGFVVYTTTYAYDNLGRVQRIDYPQLDTSWAGVGGNPTKRVNLTYNAQEGHKTLDYASAPVITRTDYDSGSSPTEIETRLWQPGFSSYRPTLVRESRTYDELHRLKSIHVRNEEELYHAYDMRYDAQHFITSLTRSDPGLHNSSNPELVSYRYDSRGRLERFLIRGSEQTYSYDDQNNLNQSDLYAEGLQLYGPRGFVIGPATLWGYGSGPGVPFNEENRWSGAGVAWDPSGKLTNEYNFSFDYDRSEHLAGVSRGAATNRWPVANFLRDANGQRVREVARDRVIYSVRDLNGRLLMQEVHYSFAGGMPVRRDILYHNASPVAVVTTWANQVPRVQYRFHDRLGNPAVILDAAHDFAKEYYEYAPYGQQVRTEAYYRWLIHEFTGHERDAILPAGGGQATRDFYEMQHRYYDLWTSRFTRPDPALDFNPQSPASFNLYNYAHSNPVNYVDRDGQIAFLPVLAVAWAVAETGFTAYDFYNIFATIADPNATGWDVGLAMGGAALGVVLPGGGYGTAGKVGERAAGEMIEEATQTGFVIIGETMTRVKAVAKQIPGSKIIPDMPGLSATGLDSYQRARRTGEIMQYNRKWFLEQLRSGLEILNTGPDPSRAIPSIFYETENSMMRAYKKLHPEFDKVVTH